MCGIVGIASQRPSSKREWLADGRDAMLHRGPDDAGEWWSADGCVGLAHRRLSIIDLSFAGHQPMTDTSGNFRIVLNGEIYNHNELRKELISKDVIFHSQTDTEVILAAYRMWGIECLSRLNGMFAFALYDVQRRTIFLVRDRAGEKPLFYRYDNNILRFASELKGLLADPDLPRVLNLESLDSYLAFGYVPGNRCILEGFNKLPPAHVLRFDLIIGKLSVWRYWQLPELDLSSKIAVNETDLLDELEILLEKSVRCQSRADVPVGVLLSGGVDSSLVTAMAARSSNKVKTFTIRFPEHAKFDETEHARLVARHFNTDHVELEAQQTTVALLSCLARQFDEPMADSSMIPTFLVSQLIREHCTVALGGDGGDELFGGYGHYSQLLKIHTRFGVIPRILRTLVSRTSEHFLSVGFKGRNYLQGLGGDLKNGVPLVAPLFDPSTRRRLMKKQGRWIPSAELLRNAQVPLHAELLQRVTRMDFTNYLAEDILVKVDRASMLNSLELRSPFLDQHLIEFAFAKVPSRLKATSQEKKILLKRLAARVLPPEFDRQRKQGFSIPLAEWLKAGAFRKFFHEVLLDPGSVYDQGVIRSLLRGQDHGRANSERLFSLVLFELWQREYAVSL